MPLMENIFRYGLNIILWTGREDSDEMAAFQLLHSLTSLYDEENATVTGLISFAVKSPTFRPAWISLGIFLKQSYWSRLWILQQIVLPPDALSVCEAHSIRGDVIRKAIASFSLHRV